MNPIKKKIFKIKLQVFFDFLLVIIAFLANFVFELEISSYDENGNYQLIKHANHSEIVMFVCVLVFVFYILHNTYIHKGIIRILYDKLDPVMAEEVYREVYKKSQRKFKILFLSLTKFYAGDFSESIQMTKSILESGMRYENYCLLNMALCCYFSGDYMGTNFFADKVINNYKYDAKKYRKKEIKELAYLIKYLVENDPRSIQSALEILKYSKADYKINLLLEKFLLAQAYCNQGIYDESKKLLTEVASEGNKIFLVDRANELLQKIRDK